MRVMGFVLISWMFVAGCADNAPDANVEVFQTVNEVAAARRARQVQIWKDAAASMMQTERADVKATPAAEGFAIDVEADGLRHQIDLSPIAEPLAAESARSTEVLREHLRRQLPAFDQQRMAKLPLERVRPRIRPVLVNSVRLDEASAAFAGDAPLPAKHVIFDLYWIPAVRWQQRAVATPVGPEALKAWQIPLEDLQRIALDNLRGEVKGELFDTSAMGPAGNVGYLKPGVEAAVVLLPEFLHLVRQAWGTEDNLALMLAAEDQIRFTEAGNKRLLDLLWPQWRGVLMRGLSTRLVMLTEGGITGLDYTPPLYVPGGGTTRPSVAGPRGPASRPSRPAYIAR
jgi:hypothetical protein